MVGGRASGRLRRLREQPRRKIAPGHDERRDAIRRQRVDWHGRVGLQIAGINRRGLEEIKT